MYTVCGKCSGSSEDPSRRWRCHYGEGPDRNGKVTVYFKLFPHCDFQWKWRDFDNTAVHYGYEPPYNDKIVKDNDHQLILGVDCPAGQIMTVRTVWGERGPRPNYGGCEQDTRFSSITARPTLPSTREITTPTSTLAVTTHSVTVAVRFILNMNGQLSNHLYTLCGICLDSKSSPALRQWICLSEKHLGDDGSVKLLHELDTRCDFNWKWRDVSDKRDHGGYEPPFNENGVTDGDRQLWIGSLLCSPGEIKTVYTTWGIRDTRPYYAVCEPEMLTTTGRASLSLSSSPPSATTILPDDADNTVATSTLALQTETAVSSTASLITTVDANVQGNSTLSNSTSTSQPVGGQVLLPKTLLPTKCPAKDVLISLKVGYLSAKVVLPNNDIMELPAGLYPYTLRMGGGEICNFVINIFMNSSNATVGKFTHLLRSKRVPAGTLAE